MSRGGGGEGKGRRTGEEACSLGSGSQGAGTGKGREGGRRPGKEACSLRTGKPRGKRGGKGRENTGRGVLA